MKSVVGTKESVLVPARARKYPTPSYSILKCRDQRATACRNRSNAHILVNLDILFPAMSMIHKRFQDTHMELLDASLYFSKNITDIPVVRESYTTAVA
jgi:hypothetical protein